MLIIIGIINMLLAANKCYGGIARLAAAIKEVRVNATKENKHVILLNAGDIFQGTVWYSKYKWKYMARFTNILNITAAVSITFGGNKLLIRGKSLIE